MFAAMAAHTASKLGDRLACLVQCIAAEFDAKVASFDGDSDQEAVSGAVTCHCEHSRTCVLVFVECVPLCVCVCVRVCVCVCLCKFAKAQTCANVQYRFGTMGSLQVIAPLPAHKGHEACRQW